MPLDPTKAPRKLTNINISPKKAPSPKNKKQQKNFSTVKNIKN
jgi:hypothetical protein